MAYGLLKRAGAFLLASAMAFGTVSPSLAESLGSDAGGTEDAAETAQVDTGSETGTEAENETTPPAGSYIICLPEDTGAEYSYDAAHRLEEGSDDAFTILLYEEEERVVIGVTAELGFGL